MPEKIESGHRDARRVRKLPIIVGFIAASIAVLGAAYFFLLPGLSTARKEPPAIETGVATWLLRHSVPESAKNAVNPLGKDPADITAGRELFRGKCESCHAYDGGGKTEMGAGMYPRPPVLRSLVTSLSDGEIFYHIRNGIRNTAMPAWNMPDRETWQVVAYIRHLPIVTPLAVGHGADREPE